MDLEFHSDKEQYVIDALYLLPNNQWYQALKFQARL